LVEIGRREKGHHSKRAQESYSSDTISKIKPKVLKMSLEKENSFSDKGRLEF
jgi:hypothetical protein